MTLTVTVLGASGTAPGPGTACSGYLVQSSTTNLWVDCGTGTLANLQHHVDIGAVDGIVCSHSHPDHWLELPVLANLLRYVRNEPDAAIPLLWTAETAELFGAVAGRSADGPFAPRTVDETSTARIGDIDLRFSRTDHPVETLAVRADFARRDGASPVETGLSGGDRVATSIAYSADTGAGWELTSLGEGIDLAVVEATLDESEADLGIPHLSAAQAGARAARAGVAGLLLTHLAPGADPARRIADAATTFSGPIAVATTHQRYPSAT